MKTTQLTDYQYWSAAVTFRREIEGPKGGIKIKNVKERYLVYGVSPVDVQTQLAALLKDCVEEWEIKSISATNYVQVLAPKNKL